MTKIQELAFAMINYENGDPKCVDCHRVNTSICIGCMKCVSVCPSQARNLPQEHLTRIETMSREACLSRKNNELFI